MGITTKPKGRGFGLNSVFVRCAGIVALTTVIVASVMSYQSTNLIRKISVGNVVVEATKSIDAMAESLVKPVRFKALPKVEEAVLAAMASAGPNGTAMVVVDAEANVMAVTGEDADAVTAIEALAAQAVQTAAPVETAGGLTVARPIFAAPGGPVIGAVAAAWNAETALTAAWNETLVILGTASLIFAAMMAVALFLFRRVLSVPLRNVAQTLEKTAEGHLDEEVTLAARKDEFGMVGTHLNSLRHSLRDARATKEAAAEDATYQAEVVAHLSTALDALADGILTREIEAEFKEDYAALRENYNRAIGKLRDLINQVSDGAAGLQHNADQIAASSDDLSRRTETQAATLEQSAAALEELLSNVSSAASNARQAASFVKETQTVAEENGEIMKSAIDAMTAIEKSSDEISAITNVIDDIAFQTNLLALNAGVEAARAGPSGKGFAVVATEVRGLAQRSAAAAQQIKNLIDSSGDQVESGVQLVKEAGETLKTVLTKVSGVSDMVANIAAGADEQSVGLKEINVGISNLDQVTQQNASMVQETASSAFEMRAKATGLSQLVNQFETGTAAGAPDLQKSAA